MRVSCSTYLELILSISESPDELTLLDKVLLGDVTSGQISDPIDRHDTNVLNCP